MLLPSRTSCLSVGAVAVLVGILSACAPPPEPTPSPTPAFASEEEAFAAAEKVYRAYNDAVNAERAGEESVDPARFLVGPALESSIATNRELDRNGLTLSGSGEVSHFSGLSARLEDGSVTLALCLDVSGTRVSDATENDVTPVDRPVRGKLEVDFVMDESALVISDSRLAEESTC